MYSISIFWILIHVLICCETVYTYLEDNIRKKYKESASVDVKDNICTLIINMIFSTHSGWGWDHARDAYYF